MNQTVPKDKDKLIGQTIDGKYRVLERIGRGGMGAVYKAEHILMERTVALKVIHSNLVDPDDDEFLKRFTREAKTTSKIKHPNAVTIHDFGVADDIPYLVMEYVAGTSLKELLLQEGPLVPSRIVKITSQVCAALEEAHSHGIIHRDLKPDNIIISKHRDGTEWAVVLDFGIAKVIGQVASEQTLKTHTGRIIGTPQYMSPEQITAKPLDARSDLYSLAIIIYQMFTGEPPFRADSVGELMVQHLSNLPQSMLDFKPELKIPAPFDAIVLRALSKDPANRQQSALELSNEMQQASTGAPNASAATSDTTAATRLVDSSDIIGAASKPKDIPSRKRGLAISLVGLLACVLCIGYFALKQLGQNASEAFHQTALKIDAPRKKDINTNPQATTSIASEPASAAAIEKAEINDDLETPKTEPLGENNRQAILERISDLQFKIKLTNFTTESEKKSEEEAIKNSLTETANSIDSVRNERKALTLELEKLTKYNIQSDKSLELAPEISKTDPQVKSLYERALASKATYLKALEQYNAHPTDLKVVSTMSELGRQLQIAKKSLGEAVASVVVQKVERLKSKENELKVTEANLVDLKARLNRQLGYIAGHVFFSPERKQTAIAAYEKKLTALEHNFPNEYKEVLSQGVPTDTDKLSLTDDKSPESIAALVQQLKSKSRSERITAADQLVALGEPAIEPVLQAAKDKNSGVRYWAIRVLGNLKAEKAVDTLVLALKDPNRDIQTQASDALQLIGTSSAQAALKEWQIKSEAERARLAEVERVRFAEAEKVRLAEAERMRVAELERTHLAETEQNRSVDAEKIRAVEVEPVRLKVASNDHSLQNLLSHDEQLISGINGSPAEKYRLGLLNFRKGNFGKAVEIFTQFTRENPGTAFTDNAYFWVGISNLEIGHLSQSAGAFGDVIQKYPAEDMVAPSLFYLADSFIKLGAKNDAILSLEKLMDENRDSVYAQKARGVLLRLKGGLVQATDQSNEIKDAKSTELFCGNCFRSKAEIEKDGESFEFHLRNTNGIAVTSEQMRQRRDGTRQK